jgi:hypothetical protein
MRLLGRDTDAQGFDEAARKHAELAAAEEAKN